METDQYYSVQIRSDAAHDTKDFRTKFSNRSNLTKYVYFLQSKFLWQEHFKQNIAVMNTSDYRKLRFMISISQTIVR